VRNRAPEPPAAGDYPVVLEPAAVSSILLFAAYQGFGAQEVEEQASFLCGRMGTRCFSELLTVHDDAANPLYPGFLFDGEGSPRRRVALIEEGTLSGPVTDRRWAARSGQPNTGHARPQPTAEGPRAENLCVAPGATSRDELIAGLERGLLVTQFHYTNLIDPRSLLLTGMTRNGTFLVEDGRIVRAVHNLRFTDSLVRAFAGVRAVGRELEVVGALFDGEVVCPALALDSFRFTSTTDF
jgi:PmbA protein